ncbi:tRNA (adenosine(37)-N6)-dimethylallyltransferase MiaA [Dichotomicrobium thermohalophilum]|uniref:tRNA dimethylallyltransferase n=1 Tax=Dichotomicrobium thermohalophilum TaxID=933063 RepID=A0A397Q4H3_9HYPH|nr:tRNA (adenosine(37)-N6)-dimethylallyltransferase MiaA [Dichotomicrobium thermohalophilum]RIA56022.1 tRNA dimethylallyltransferase [Dichotomicrobium thermohalophilum]
MTAKDAILIAGPTASGKSAFALDLAERRGGLIINADSMQVYRELRIVTARPSESHQARVPHRLYGVRSGVAPYSVGQWLDDAAEALREARESGLVPIFVGGTGLYFKALLEGLSPVPEIPDDIRSYWRERARIETAAALHTLLGDRDPAAAAQLRPSDTQRIVRALEVVQATGQSITQWQQGEGTPLLNAEQTEKYVVAPDRATLYRACDARAARMVEDGAIEEVAALLRLGLDPALPVMRAIGVRPLGAYLRGETDLETALSRLQTETRRYAKRQLTWARRNMISWGWIEPE